MRRQRAIRASVARINSLVASRGIRVLDVSRWSDKFKHEWDSGLLPFLFERDPRVAAKVSVLLETSTAQLAQDLMVLAVLGLKRDGYFVEFGATDGKYLSNTFLLEKSFGWSGILAEPAPVWSEALRRNRSCRLDNRLVASVSGQKVDFFEADRADLSTQVGYESPALRAERGRIHQVETVSLDDLLSHHGAPINFDYLSIDTEGSEMEVLSGFTAEHWLPRVITIEHNFLSSQQKILDRFLTLGYRQLPPELSRWDSWLVLE